MARNRQARKVAVVTGASRGAGRGIARALGEQGFRVYVTGRTLTEGDADLPGTIGRITIRPPACSAAIPT